jgi:hypothetical protein
LLDHKLLDHKLLDHKLLCGNMDKLLVDGAVGSLQ